MHIWQAIKMAFKSLWTNKLRSFLTMLGIIIGVVTVSLLTTVAQGVTDMVVSSIRDQSTLTIVMGMSENATYSKISTVLQKNQPEDKNAEDYFAFSLVNSANATVAKTDLTGMEDSDTYGYLVPGKTYTQAELDEMKNNPVLAPYVEMLANLKRAEPVKTFIYAVDDNFTDVYNLSYEGEFPKQTNEILVDGSFVKTYLGENISNSQAVGKSVTLGIEVYESISIKFSFNVDDTLKAQVLAMVSNFPGIKVQSTDGSEVFDAETTTNIQDFYTYDEHSFIMTIRADFYRYMNTSQELKESLEQMFASVPSMSTFIAQDGIAVQDVYDKTNSRVFTISGVLDDENSQLFTGSTSGDDADTSPMMSMFGASTQGTVYMLLDESNFGAMGVKKYSTVAELPIFYGYLRYKSEDVMNASSSQIMASLMMDGGLEFGTDFMVVSMNSVASIISNVMDVLTIMLTVISVISLIVGGIGIMNIMLVAVTERTREIGIRKAIGAKRASILVQFLIEALMLSIVGCVIGLIISAIGSLIIGNVMGIALSMPGWVIAMSVGFCSAIGLIFGMFPAIKASHMQPIDALRRD